MATLTLSNSFVWHNGRVVRLWHRVTPKPTSVGWPDWRPSWIANGKLTISGGRTLEPMGQMCGDWTMPRPHMASYTGTQVLTPGGYYCRVSLTDSNNNEIHLSALGGRFDSNANASGSFGLILTAGQEMAVYFPEPIPTGYTGNIYLNTAPNQDPSGLRLWKSGIAAGSRRVIIDNANFENSSRGIPSVWGWASDWEITDPSKVITFGESLTMSAPQGLLTDEFGNDSASLSNVALTNYSYAGTNGHSYAGFTPVNGGRYFYISNTFGNDNNDGLTPQTALKTIGRLNTMASTERAKLRGKGSIVRICRGDTFPENQANFNSCSGESFDRPIVIEDYWDASYGADPGTPPIITNSTNTGIPVQFQGFTGMTEPPKFVIMRRLHIKANPAFPTSQVSGLSTFSGIRHWMFDDLIVQGFRGCFITDGSVLSNWGGDIRQSTIHRCRILDSNGMGGGSGTICYGGHADNGSELMMSQSLANHNGLWDGVYQGNVFSHGIYWQHAMGHTCLWANVIDDGGSHCIQNRGGGIAAKNLFSRHGIGILMLNLGGTVANNVFCELRDILDGQYRGEAIQLGVGSPVAGYGLIENNLILHANVVSGVNAFSVDTGNSASGNNALQQAARPLFLWERNDTALQHGPTQWDIVLPAKHRRNNNISQNIAAGSDLLFKASFSASPDWSMLESDYNVYFSAMSNPFSGISGASSFATWRQVTGNDAHLINQSVTFANGNYKLNNYAQELGYADWSALITAARGRAMGAWLEDFGGSKALGLFAAAYRPTNLAGLGNGPFDYVGAVDYRQPVAVSYTLTGPGTGQVNQAIVYTVQPTAASSETLGLSDSDGSGIFTPTSLTWNGTADPLQFQYVPKTQGAQTIAVTRQGTSLATRSLSVSGSPRRLERRYGALRGSVGCGID